MFTVSCLRSRRRYSPTLPWVEAPDRPVDTDGQPIRHRQLAPLARLIVLRVTRSVGLLLVISVLIFAATDVLPGDAASQRLGQNFTKQRYAILRKALGLDRPAPVRYLHWLAGLLHGNLGASEITNRPVTSIIGGRLTSSMALAGLAFGAIVVVSLTLGLISGSDAGGRSDGAISVGALIALSLPEFILAALFVVVFATWLMLFPAISLVPAGGTPLNAPSILVLPVLTLTVAGSSYSTRLVRAAVADANRLPHVEAARLSGLSRIRVLIRHLLPSALGPIAQVFASSAGFLVGGTIIVEQVFNYPGLGEGLVEAINNRDVIVVQGIALLIAVAVVGTFLIADLIGLAANPRLRIDR
jgi:peptide/nickel transport system permease protein